MSQPDFEIGDKVRYTNDDDSAYKGLEGEVTEVWYRVKKCSGKNWPNGITGDRILIKGDSLELIEPTTIQI